MKKLLLLAAVAGLIASCNDKSSATTGANNSDSTSTTELTAEGKEERNKQTALASLNAVDGETSVDEVFRDADKDLVEYGSGEMPPVKGVDSAKAWLQTWVNAVPDYKGSDLTAVADGDYVMVEGTWSGTWKNNMMGMNATNKSFRIRDVDIFKFNDAGKMIEHRSVQSMNEVSKQLGMKMKTQ
jgi:predicted ester cyclase